MKNLSKEAEAIMIERFGRDSIISLATAVDNVPYVRSVDAYYEDGAFYVLTHALSGKMKQIGENPIVAVSGEWFSAQGRGINLGWFGKAENAPIADKMRRVFSAWIDNGHNNFEDENTCILCIRLSTGVLFANGIRYETDFR
ncbi:MAG: pyridoxamine 5'-phosphate oxidase family protein [Oscillospiraceae bacterium]|nr:pyridoxamine 5'-phosphate oxidase family protein [Oscillospiraceae bacterium]